MDQDLWAAVIEAEQSLAKAQVEFYEQASSRRAVLADALAFGPPKAWEHHAALSFLRSFPADVPALVDLLVVHSTTDRHALRARRALAAGVPVEVRPLVREAVRAQLLTADVDDYCRLAELLHHLNDHDAFQELVESARRSTDQETHELADELSSW